MTVDQDLERRAVGGDDLALLELEHPGLAPVRELVRGEDGRLWAAWERRASPPAPSGAEGLGRLMGILPALEFLRSSGFAVGPLSWEDVRVAPDGSPLVAPLAIPTRRASAESSWGPVLAGLLPAEERSRLAAVASLGALWARLHRTGTSRASISVGRRPLRGATLEALARGAARDGGWRSFRLAGAAGSGRSTLLGRLRRRLLALGAHAVLVDASPGGGAGSGLARLLEASGQAPTADPGEALRRLRAASMGARGVAILVDGAGSLDGLSAEALLGFAAREHRFLLGVSATGGEALGTSLDALEPIPLPPLPSEELLEGFAALGTTPGSRRRAREALQWAVETAGGCPTRVDAFLRTVARGEPPPGVDAGAVAARAETLLADGPRDAAGRRAAVDAVDRMVLCLGGGAPSAEAAQGRLLLDLGRPQEALDALQAAAAAGDAAPAIVLALGRAYAGVQAHDEALATLSRLRAHGDDGPLAVAAGLLTAEIHWRRGRFAEARREADAALEGPHGPDERTLLLSLLGALAGDEGRHEDAARLFGEAASVVGCGDVARARALQRRARWRKLQGDTAQWLALSRDAESWFRRGGDLAGAAGCLVDVANGMIRAGGGQEAMALYDRALGEAEASSDMDLAAIARFNRNGVLAERGEWTRSYEAFEGAARLDEESGNETYLALDRAWLGILEAWWGRPGPALALLDAAGRDLRAAGEEHNAMEVALQAAEIHWRARSPERCRARLAGLPDTLARVQALGILATLAADGVPGDPDVERLRRTSMELGAEEEPGDVALVAIALAEIAERSGDAAGAGRALVEGLDRLPAGSHLYYEADLLARLLRVAPAAAESRAARIARAAERLQAQGAAAMAAELGSGDGASGWSSDAWGAMERAFQLASPLADEGDAGALLRSMVDAMVRETGSSGGALLLAGPAGGLWEAAAAGTPVSGAGIASVLDARGARDIGAAGSRAAVRRCLAMPLRVRGEAIGALVIERAPGGPAYAPNHRRLLEALGIQASPFVALQRRALLAQGAPGEDVEAALLPGIVGASAALRAACEVARAAASKPVPVLLRGESGTGKEVFARAIHELSARRGRPFIALNVGAMPDALATSELQGVRRGAFSGAVADRAGHAEQASGGTLFLDEIGDIGPGIQVALLRLLQEGEVTRLGESTPRKVDVRFLFATHRDLEHGIREGWFRQDLYYRVNVVSITIPPLRERPEDLPGLLRSVGGRVAARFGIPPPSFAPAAIAVLQAFPWPGNVRQLENVLQQTFVNLRGDEVRPADLPAELRTRREADAPEGLRPAVERFEREYVSGVLRRCGGNRSQAARVLGLSRQGLLGKLKSLGIQDELPPAPAGAKPRGKR